MPLQTVITPYPAASQAGESHNNARHTSIFQTCNNPNQVVRPGVAQVQVGFYDHTRYTTVYPSATNLVPGANLVIPTLCRTAGNAYNGTSIGATANVNGFVPTGIEYPSDCQYLAMRRGTIWVVVEKDIDPNNPLFIRVDGVTNVNQGIGYFTDTADGTNTVEITDLISRDTNWCGVDATTLLSSKDPNLTAVTERTRLGLTRGYSIAPISIKYV